MVLGQLLLSREAIGVYALALAAIEKKFQFIKPVVKYVEEHKGFVKTAEQDVVKAANDVFHSPELAALKLKADELAKKVETSQIYKVATAVLHNLSVKVEDLTPEMTNVVALTISNEAYRLFGLKVTVKQVTGVLDEFRKLAGDLGALQSVKSTEDVIAPKSVPQDQTTPVENGQPASTTA